MLLVGDDTIPAALEKLKGKESQLQRFVTIFADKVKERARPNGRTVGEEAMRCLAMVLFLL